MINLWRAYMIRDRKDVMSALERYQLSTGEMPTIARISINASKDMIDNIRSLGLRVEVSNNLLSNDLWLSSKHIGE